MVRYDPGLPPRTRGSLRLCTAGIVRVGSTPAYAGITAAYSRGVSPQKVYPRVRGDHDSGAVTLSEIVGLPPRTRGSRWGSSGRRNVCRSTPAYAGITISIAMRSGGIGVYPRVRGDHLAEQGWTDQQIGLPPRTRGSLFRPPVVDRVDRSTPAYAGITPAACRMGAPQRVYPRVRGDHFLLAGVPERAAGLPPRTRGSP